MNTKDYDLEIKRVSDLPEIDDPNGFWIFGSKNDSEKTATSVKYPFSKLMQFANSLQLERRIALSMERSEQIIPIGEDMTVYKAKAKNVAKLEIKAASDDHWIEVPLDVAINIALQESIFEYVVRVTPSSTMSSATVYLFGKVKI